MSGCGVWQAEQGPSAGLADNNIMKLIKGDGFNAVTLKPEKKYKNTETKIYELGNYSQDHCNT